ncbi:MAG TPA: PilZ domain-containing protein [Pyrinomonadaceae bacterium]|nr:PilZ domain-containing protein [Pyrinomonadaceae bacterium]
MIGSMWESVRKLIGNRRKARRRRLKHRANLAFTLLPLGERRGIQSSQLTQLVGETRHISENGLALIMRGFRMDDLYLSQTVCITLELPSAPIRLRGTPVRLERLDRGIEDRSLICVRITEMDRRDRARYNRYLRRLRLLAPNLAPLLTAGQALE